MSAKSIKVELTDDNDNVVKTYVINKATVAETARRFSLTGPVMENENLTDQERGQMLNCCVLASCLRDENGELLYTGKDAAETIYNDMDYDLFKMLVDTYLELNPVGKSLSAKKKIS